MIRRSLREWQYLPVNDSEEDGAISRVLADRLVETARAARIGGDDGEGILVNGARKLRAQQVVGVIAADGITLEILPKIDGADDAATRRNLVHMLATVLDLEIASGSMTELGWQRYDLLEILIRLFIDKLFEALHRGLPRRYVGCEDDLLALRGRLDVRRQFTVLAASPQKLACRYEELSPDIALNQVMKAAISRLASVSRAPENQRRLGELSFAYNDVAQVPVKSLPWERIIIDRTNSRWRELLSLAKLLLGGRFQTTSSGDARGFSLLFEMNTLFEEFIGRKLRLALSGTGIDVQLQGPRDYALVELESGTRRFATRPDIVLSRNGTPLSIIDTKWKRLKGAIDDAKRGVGQADVYQMMAYAHVYRCTSLMLLYPHHDELGPTDGILTGHRVTGTTDTRLQIATIDCSALARCAQTLSTIVALPAD